MHQCRPNDLCVNFSPGRTQVVRAPTRHLAKARELNALVVHRVTLDYDRPSDRGRCLTEHACTLFSLLAAYNDWVNGNAEIVGNASRLAGFGCRACQSIGYNKQQSPHVR